MILKVLFSIAAADTIGIVLIHFIWQAAVVALITYVISLISKKTSARLRYVIYFLSLLLMILLPIFTVHMDLYKANDNISETAANKINPVQSKVVIENGRYIGTQYRRSESLSAYNEEIISLIEPYLPYITTAWLIGVFTIFLFHVFGFLKFRKLIQQIRLNLDSVWEKKILRLINNLNIQRKIQISKLPGLEWPVVVGFLRPVLLIPVSFFTGMNDEFIESIILHELAHIKRYDYFMNMVQAIIETLGFFHPAVWWISKKIREERENCCDDIAINEIGDSLIYVKSLVKLEESRANYKLMVAANGGNLFRRITRILGLKCSTGTEFSLNVVGFIITFLCLFVLMGFIWKQDLDSLENNRVDAANGNLIRKISQNLVAYYPFNGNANDESGYNQDGVVHNASLTEDRSGHPGRAFDFNGKNSFIMIPKTPALNTFSSITISCWIFPRKFLKYESWISKVNPGSCSSQWRTGFGEDLNHEWGLTECHSKDKQNIWTDYWITHSSIPLNRWTQFTVVADQSAASILLYVNGIKVGRFDNLKTFEQSESPLYIGCQKDDGVFFNGKIDDIRIYNRALNDDEVNAVYNLK